MSLLVRGPTANVATGSQTFTYNGASVTKTDRHLRQVYSVDVHRKEPGEVTAMPTPYRCRVRRISPASC